MKTLRLDDYNKIKPYLDLANYEGYNSNFITMMMWNHEYHIQYEIHEHFLIMLHHYKEKYFWSMPFTTPDYYQEALDYMIHYSHEHEFDFMIDCAIEDFVNQLKSMNYPNLLYKRTPDNDDYIYDRFMHQNLSGKKMQKRRNHYNAFIKNYPNYVYRELNEIKDFDLILECLTRWNKDKDSVSESMTSEIYGIMYLLSTKQFLDFKVGGIFIDGIMEAFIIGSPLKHQTIQIHVEKANKNIRGLYPAILKEFLEHSYPDALYINREEDMGLDNLKKSKLALHPVKMVYKYQITLNDTTIMKATEDDKDAIIHLWRDNFSDETKETTDFYFDYCYHPEYTYVLKNKNEIVSVCQIIPYQVMKDHTIQSYDFIAGVCTRKEYEGQGCMKKLLSYILNQPEHQGNLYLQAYIPDIYRSLGFSISHYQQIIEVKQEAYTNEKPLQRKENYTGTDLLNLYNKFVKNFNEYRIRDIHYYEDYFIPRTNIFNQNIIMFEENRESVGYIVYEKNKHSITIYEIIYQSQDILNKMISYLVHQKYDTIIIHCDLKAKIYGQRELSQVMMSRQINQDIYIENNYINEIY